MANTPEDPLQSGSTPESKETSPGPPPIEKFVSLAKKDLADRLQIDMNRITLRKTVAMVWPNAALGCPRPGKVYQTGKIPGYQISLVAPHVEYVYNTDWINQVILCLKQGRTVRWSLSRRSDVKSTFPLNKDQGS
jgi:hypothetical protein